MRTSRVARGAIVITTATMLFAAGLPAASGSPAAPQAAVVAAGVPSAAKPRATLSVIAVLLGDGSVRVTVTTNASKVKIKYKLGRKTKSRTVKVRGGSATITLPKGVTLVSAVTKKAKKLRPSVTVRVVPAAAPAIVPPAGSSGAGGSAGGVGGAGGSGGGGGGAGGTTPPPPPPPPPPANPPVNNPGAIRQVSTNGAGVGGNGEAGSATYSPDGNFAAFYSISTDLVPDGNNGAAHVYLKNLATGALRLVDRTPAGVPANNNNTGVNAGLSFSPDGQWLAFCSTATNLVGGAPVDGYGDLYRVHLGNGTLNWLAPGCRSPRFSPDGAKIAWTTSYAWLPAWDTDNGDSDVYAGFLPPANTHGLNPIAMVSSNAAGQGPDSPGSDTADNAAWSPDSTRVAFTSSTSNLVPGDTNIASDIFVKTMGADLNGDAIARVSTSAAGSQANSGSSHPTWSPDGTRVAFASRADNLVAGDVNPWDDIFIKDVGGGGVQLISVDNTGASNYQRHKQPRWSPDGTRVAFTGHNVATSGYDADGQVYVKNLVTGWRQVVSTTPAGVVGNSSSSLWDTGNVWAPDSSRLLILSNATNFSSDANAWQQDVFEKTLG